jgi:hypothetical protein
MQDAFEDQMENVQIMDKLYYFRVLLRVRLLYYLREEIIGNAADKINKGLDVR